MSSKKKKKASMVSYRNTHTYMQYDLECNMSHLLSYFCAIWKSQDLSTVFFSQTIGDLGITRKLIFSQNINLNQ